MFFRFLLLIFVIIATIFCDAVNPLRAKREEFQADTFLETFGYLDDISKINGTGGHDPSDRERAIKEFQKMTGLPVTGELNKETITKMKSPRCGFRDVLRPSERPGEINRDPKNVELKPLSNVYKWPNNRVTWKIMGYTRQLGGTSQRQSYINAFKKWTDVANIDAREVASGNADILISYARGDHFDGSPFDGRGRTLAHAFFPGGSEISGDTHFDDDEQWTLDSNQGTNLEIVAAHEFGHALGLGHSTDPKALMAPYYQGYDPNYKLNADDIRRMQSLYGPRTATVTTTIRPGSTSKSPNPDICDLKFDAIFLNGDDGRLYALRESKIYQFESSHNGIVKNFTKLSRKVLTPKVPTNPGASVMDKNRHLYIFKGSKLFRYTRFRLDDGFPKKITIPFFQNIDAAVLYNDAIYVFKDDQFSVWHESYRTGPPAGYPKPISSFWNGIPNNIEGAVNINDGYTYFFKGPYYFKFENLYKRTLYRKLKAAAWLGCGTPEPK